MAGLLAQALAIAVITVGPGPFPCGQGQAHVRDSCAVPPNRVYVTTGYWSGTENLWESFRPWEVLGTRNHELGHVIDYNFLTDQDRGMFSALIRTKRPWRSPGGNSVHERFAEAVRLCATSTRWVSHADNGGYLYEPSLHLHRKVCRWLTMRLGSPQPVRLIGQPGETPP